MKNSITEINQKNNHKLDDGVYIGKYGGSLIRVKVAQQEWELKTEIGVKGIGINVVVTVENGAASFAISRNQVF